MASSPRERNIQVLIDQLGPISRPARASPVPTAKPDATAAGPVLVLDVRRLQLRDVLKDGSLGQLVWGAETRRFQPSALYSYHRHLLTIHEVSRDGSIRQVDAHIEVVWLAVFGQTGSRPWLACPRQTDRGVCGQRAMKLYLRDGDSEFACRACIGGGRRSLRLAQITTATSHRLPA